LTAQNFGTGIAKGMMVTFKHLFRHPVTNQYPNQRLNTSRRIRGNELVWSRKRCTGCGTCAKTCHIGAIRIVTSPNMKDNKYEVLEYKVDTGYCIQCGLCVEACPYSALYMGSTFEKAKYRRGEVIQDRDMMLEKPNRPVSGYYYPEIAEKLPKQTLLVEKIVEKRRKPKK
jgi:formate hydrogenlyase subunit 6/NADH:ubiquinone oxidoreductase subunit I